MSARTTEETISSFRLNFKISFLQDVFTIIEELTGDSPGVGLPDNFYLMEKNEYEYFKNLQDKYNLTKLFITNFNKIKKLDEWKHIKKIIDLYKPYWEKNKYKIYEAKKHLLGSVKISEFLKELQEVTKTPWTKKALDVFLTIGYKNSGTYDREISVIRLGIHENNKEYLLYTLYHELIHFHIINHMKLKLKEEEEEILCRAIFKLVFKNDPIAQNHWIEKLSDEEIGKINKKTEEF